MSQPITTPAAVQIQIAAHEFLRGGASTAVPLSNAVFRFGARDMYQDFKIPDMVRMNGFRVPGWFLAGVWDYMELAHFNQFPDNSRLLNWSFRPSNLRDSPLAEPEYTLWSKPLFGGNENWLIYEQPTGKLQLKNLIAGSTTDKGVIPKKSIFHVQKLFEENGWFDNELPMPSLDIYDYIIRK